MGTTSSIDINLPANFDFFSIQMDRIDRFRLILAPPDILELTLNTISLTWPIQDVTKKPGFSEIKLSGFPWHSLGEDDLSVKYFICSILQKYAEHGWHLVSSSDINRKDNDCNALFFERRQPVSTSVICLSLNSSDKIRVLAPENVIPLVRQALVKAWPKGIQRERLFGDGYEFKLEGYPWEGWESVKTPIMMNEIFKDFFANGWNFLGAIDTASRERGLNAIYFQYSASDVNDIEKANSRFFSLTIDDYDKVRLHRAPEELIANISSQMPNIWPKGIQRQGVKDSSYEYKLHGNPWASHASEAVESRLLLNNMLNLLSQYGWDLYATCDLTKQANKKSSFFFRSKLDSSTSIASNFCLAINSFDKFRVINGSSRIIDSVRQAISLGWYKGISREQNYYGSWEFKLHGFPFSSSMSVDRVNTCVMILHIFQQMKLQGTKFICSADVSGKYTRDEEHRKDDSIDVHSFFFTENT